MKIPKPPGFVLSILLPVALLPIVPSFAWFQNDGDFKISTNVDLVLLDISVKEAKGGYVTNLSKDNFKIEENGIIQKITSFSNADVPVTAGLVLDASGSMGSKRPEVNIAGLTFVDASNPRDEILFWISTTCRGCPRMCPLPTIGTFCARLCRTSYGGKNRSLRCHCGGAEASGSGPPRQENSGDRERWGDNASKRTLAETMRLIEESHATIYTIGIYESEDPDRNPAVLRRIARVSGGECFLLNRKEDIVSTCRRIAQDIRKRYTIGYIPDRGNSKPGLRTIRVTAGAPGHGRLIVRTRTSYLDEVRDRRYARRSSSHRTRSS